MSESTPVTHFPAQAEDPPILDSVAGQGPGATAMLETWPGDNVIPAPPFAATATDIPGRYVDLQPHAKGGIGEVYRGRDAELNRPVAVKRIQPRHAGDADSRARFLLEAEVTARLDHPGVVPVYGLVQGPDGQPCYAMRFIQGESLSEAIDAYHRSAVALSLREREAAVSHAETASHTQRPRDDASLSRSERATTLTLRQLLTRFISLCNTVAYAHSRGIIHRDLKPHNVMLGGYGETLLVDWGLARPVGRTEEQRTISEESTLMPTTESGSSTRTGQAVGTPAFMSPEQAAGNWAVVGPASDVYSLGATLYMLLTGRAPFSGGWADIQQKIQRGEFARPRAVKPDVAAALEAVCLKAMAVRPEDRYADALALAADIEQWLADEPVGAYPEPVSVRVRRWVRKHPGGVAAIAATVLVGLISLASGTAIIGSKNRDLNEANTGLRTANAQPDEANGKLQTALTREQAAHKLADDRFTLALDAFKQQVFDADRLLANRAGTQELRTATMSRAVEGLQKLLGEAEKTTAAGHVRIWAYFALGDIYQHIDGRFDKARDEYATAFELARELADANPKNPEALRDLSISYERIGDVLRKQGEVQKALAHFQEKMKIDQRLADADPKDADFQRDLSISCNKIGNVLLQQGEVEKALAHYQEGLTIRKRLADADPKDTRAQRDVSVSYLYVGKVLLQRGEVQKALAQYQEGLAISQRLADADPRDTQVQRNLSVFFCRIGDVLLEQGEVEKALVRYQEGLAISQRLADADPNHAEDQRNLSFSFENIGDVLRQQGAAQKALTQYQEALTIRQRLADADPTHARAQRDLLNIRMKFFAQKNDRAALVATAEAYASLAEKDDNLAYDAGCAWSLASGLAKDDAKLREDYAGKALALLKKTPTGKDDVYSSPAKLVAHMKQDKDLDPLRQREDFKKLIAELEKKKD